MLVYQVSWFWGSIKFQDVVVLLVDVNSGFFGWVGAFCCWLLPGGEPLPFPTPFLWFQKRQPATKSKKEVIGPKSWKLSLPTEDTSGYLTGWFTPDIALLSLDVMTFFGTSSTDVQSLTLLRLFRSLRLLRLVRMMGRAHLLKEHLTGLEFMGALASATWEQCSVWFSLGQFKREKHHHLLYFEGSILKRWIWKRKQKKVGCYSEFRDLGVHHWTSRYVWKKITQQLDEKHGEFGRNGSGDDVKKTLGGQFRGWMYVWCLSDPRCYSRLCLWYLVFISI